MGDIFKHLKWIKGKDHSEAPLFRKKFVVDHFKKASIKICGLGFFQLNINGKPISKDLLVPGWSNYETRDYKNMLYPISGGFHNRIYFLEYNISEALVHGENILAIRLGNGWYNNHAYKVEGDLAYGTPKLCFELNIYIASGEVVSIQSDESVLCAESEIISNNIHYGEIHDLRKRDDDWVTLLYDDTNWLFAEIADSPQAEFCKQDFPADRAVRYTNPTLIYGDETKKMYDCGENITGYPVIKVFSKPGSEVFVRHSEEYDKKAKKLDFTSVGGDERNQEDKYICSDKNFICHPQFTWHGFRYFEIVSDVEAEVLRVEVVHADVPIISSFESSNNTLNWLYKAYIRSQLGNTHCGVVSDCPHRERLGYTGDGQITCQATMFCLDMKQIYIKWMRDIADGQDQISGHVQHTAPFFGGGGGPGGWGSVIYVIPWNFYLHYGDKSLLEEYFPNILLWLDYMESRLENGLVTHEEEGGWCLGDWCAPNLTIPEPYVNTYYYIKGLETAIKASLVLGKDIDRDLLEKRIALAKEAMVATYYNVGTGSFCNGVNGADAFAIDIGLGDSRCLESLVERYTQAKAFDTGIFGTDILVDVLFKSGYADLAYELLTSSSDVSFENMKRNGATTLWENWDGSGSHNHPMFGGVVRALFSHILGIGQKEDSCGFRDLTITPANIKALDWVKGSVKLGDRVISVSITKDANGSQSVESNIY